MRGAVAGGPILLLALSLTAGCSQDVTLPPDAGAPAGLDAAAALPGPDAATPPGPDAGLAVPTFTADAPIADGEMGLQPASALIVGDEARLEVVLGRHENVYGIAGALTYDASALQFERVESAGWLEGAEGLAVAKALPPGRLLFAVTRQGASAGAKIDEARTVGTLVFKVLRPGETRIAFLPERSTVRSDRLDYASDHPAFRGGTLVIP